MASRQCKNSPESFCYVCGYYIGDKHVSNKISKEAKYWEAYRLYFAMSIGDQEKVWAPHLEFNTECEDSISSETSDAEEEYLQSTSADRHYPSKRELDDLIRDLQLTKSAAELLTSRLSEWNLARDDCKITAYRKRRLDYSVYFDVIQDLCYCKDVNSLLVAVGIEHVPPQWRLFIDSFTKSLKGVLLHNGNKYPSIPLAYSIQMKEDYESVN
ncbi:hypothetical protein LOD99_5547 [Oopsacas minuta]|uniref:Uncharacterized protein n=1 Tax=Oopsacas minuta TaxID=111878 RepID=A0AAV7JR85_9METZ|nr:hypothetical protein LOD99_5547 [Oopsacas minuta]